MENYHQTKQEQFNQEEIRMNKQLDEAAENQAKKLNKMNQVKFYQLNGEQKIDAISKISIINKEQTILQVYSEEAITREIEQGYDPAQDFIIEIINDDQVEISVRDFA